jgi:hypothetical protein
VIALAMKIASGLAGRDLVSLLLLVGFRDNSLSRRHLISLLLLDVSQDNNSSRRHLIN